jgi:hypothetical protein
MFRPFLVAIIRKYIPSFKNDVQYANYTMFDNEISIILIANKLCWFSVDSNTLQMFWISSVAGRGQINISWVLPFPVKVKVYLLLSCCGVTLCVLCCICGCLSTGWCTFGFLVVSFYSVGKCASTNYLWNNGNVQGVLCWYLHMGTYYLVSGVQQFPPWYVCGEVCAMYGC